MSEQPNAQRETRTSEGGELWTTLLFAAFLFAPVLVLVEFHSEPTDRNGGAEVAEPGDAELGFLQKEYDTAAAEIRLRINHEHLLYALKLAVLGGILGMLFKNFLDNKTQNSSDFRGLPRLTGRQALLSWSAVMAAIIIDSRIHFNVQRIRDLGAWVRQLEALILASPTGGWEHFVSDKSFASTPFHERVHLLDRALITWVVYGVTLLLCIPRTRDDARTPHGQKQLHVARALLPATLALFGFAGSYLTWARDRPWAYAGLVTFLAGSGFFWNHWRLDPSSTERPPPGETAPESRKPSPSATP